MSNDLRRRDGATFGRLSASAVVALALVALAFLAYGVHSHPQHTGNATESVADQHLPGSDSDGDGPHHVAGTHDGEGLTQRTDHHGGLADAHAQPQSCVTPALVPVDNDAGRITADSRPCRPTSGRQHLVLTQISRT